MSAAASHAIKWQNECETAAALHLSICDHKDVCLTVQQYYPRCMQDLLELEMPPLEPGAPRLLCYVPLVEQIVPIVNAAEGYIIIDPPQGLLELATPIKEARITIKGLLPPGID